MRLTLDGRVIFVDEVGLDELDGQTRLSHTSAADYDQLVLSEELDGVSEGSERAGGRAGGSAGAPWMPLCGCVGDVTGRRDAGAVSQEVLRRRARRVEVMRRSKGGRNEGGIARAGVGQQADRQRCNWGASCSAGGGGSLRVVEAVAATGLGLALGTGGRLQCSAPAVKTTVC